MARVKRGRRSTSSIVKASILLLLAAFSLFGSAQAQGTCSDTSPCTSGCCSTSGYCGFGPDFCGNGNCTSTCGAQAECGQFAPEGHFDCPLNVCCSEYGFCGTTESFCGNNCQAGCDQVNEPSCSTPSSTKVSVGYYESWSHGLDCDVWNPEDIDANVWTHLNYAFALIGDGHRIAQMNDYDTELYTRFTGLKGSNPRLKTYISVGGWSAGGKPFSDMVGTQENRAAFIQSAIEFMSLYGFDGIDIDWEYPAADDREGVSSDTMNLVDFAKELKAACGSSYGLTVTLPSSYWYLRGFNLSATERYVDWFNFMSYDIHGTWDGNSPFTRRVVQPHTNLTEISEGLSLLWRNKVSPGKVVLGLAFYGRSFTLTDTECKEPGCPFTEGGKSGSCTNSSGILSNAEIQRIVKDNELIPVLDENAAVKYMNWDSNQWVSYDDADTLAMKRKYADNHCLRGTMVWALDLADPLTSESESNLIVDIMAKAGGEEAREHPELALEINKLNYAQNQIMLQVFWTSCSPNPTCPGGYHRIALGHGKVFDYDKHQVVADGCHGGGKGYNRALCVENKAQEDSCAWYGRAKGCSQTCPADHILISQNSHIGNEKSGCRTGYYSSFCCRGFHSDFLQVCENPGFLNGISDGKGLQLKQPQPQYGGHYGYGTGQECNNFGNMRPNGWFDIGGIPQNLAGDWDWNNNFRPLRRPPYGERDDPERNPAHCQTTITSHASVQVAGDIVTKECDYRKLGQACQHYRSVGRVNPWAKTLTCPRSDPGSRRPMVERYNKQHHKAWEAWMSLAPPGAQKGNIDRCDRDEWPPARFRDVGNLQKQWIRRVPTWQNTGAAHLPRNVCKIKSEVAKPQGGPIDGAICTVYITTTFTLPRLSLTYKNMPYDDAEGHYTNWCVPVASVTRDPGYALLSHDSWYSTVGKTKSSQAYAKPPEVSQTKGKVAPRPKAAQESNDYFVVAEQWDEYPPLAPDLLVVDDGNTTRLKTEDELFEQYDLLRCTEDGCPEEIAALDLEPVANVVPDGAIAQSEAGLVSESVSAFATTEIATPAEATPAAVVQEASSTTSKSKI